MSARVAGVGPGVFLLAFFMVFFFVAILLASKTKYAGKVFFGSTALYTILVLVLFVTPRGPAEDKGPSVDYDYNGVGRVTLALLMCVGLVLALSMQAGIRLFVDRVARPITYHQDVLKRN